MRDVPPTVSDYLYSAVRQGCKILPYEDALDLKKIVSPTGAACIIDVSKTSVFTWDLVDFHDRRLGIIYKNSQKIDEIDEVAKAIYEFERDRRNKK